MGIEIFNGNVLRDPPPLTEQELREWRDQSLMDRRHAELCEMRESQNYDFELSLERVRTLTPNSARLDIFTQATLAISANHLGIWEVQ